MLVVSSVGVSPLYPKAQQVIYVMTMPGSPSQWRGRCNVLVVLVADPSAEATDVSPVSMHGFRVPTYSMVFFLPLPIPNTHLAQLEYYSSPYSVRCVRLASSNPPGCRKRTILFHDVFGTAVVVRLLMLRKL